MDEKKKLETFEDMMKIVDHIGAIYCSEATFHYLIAALEDLGNKRQDGVSSEQIKQMLSEDPDRIQLCTTHRIPIGLAVATDKTTKKVIGVYKIPLEDKREDKGRKKNRRQR